MMPRGGAAGETWNFDSLSLSHGDRTRVETLVPMGFQAYEVFFNTFRELEPDFVKHLRSLANGGEFVSIHPFTF